jgi:hypothetical protein
LKVIELLDRWDGDDHRYFRVRTRGGGVYILRRDDNTRLWQIWFFEDGWLARALSHDGAARLYRTRATTARPEPTRIRWKPVAVQAILPGGGSRPNMTATRMIARLLLLAALFGACESAAQPPGVSADPCSIPRSLTRIRPDPSGDPVRVAVGIFLIDVAEVDAVHETFDADFRIHLRWKDPRLAATARGGSLEDCSFALSEIWNPAVIIVNRRGADPSGDGDADIDAEGTVEYVRRVYGTFSSPMILRDFPFDTQRLRMRLASIEYGLEDVIFVTDESPNRLAGMSVAGWDIVSNYNAAVDESEGPSRYTRLDHRILIARHAGYYVWKFIIPLGFIVLMAWSVFWLDPERFAPQQIAVATATIFSLVAFLVGLRNALPRVAYLTRMDELVFRSTALVFLALGVVIVTSRLASQEQAELARRIDRYGRWIYLALFGLVLVITLAY